MGLVNSDIPDAPTAHPYCHTHPDVEHMGYTEPKREIRASVRLTEEAHQLLSDMAEADQVSMKHIGSKAIFFLDKLSDREEKVGKYIEEITFKAMRLKQLVIFYVLLVGVGMGLLGYIMGLAVK